MGREYAVVCALPFSLRAEDPHQVSLFISPTIETSGQSLLGEWELFPDWGAIAAGRLRVALSDQQGILECQPQVGAIDPDLWRAMFPRDLAVRGAEVPDWSERKWRTFPARRVHDIAVGMHLATMLSDPAAPPRPSAHPLSRPLMALAAQYGFTRDERRSPEGVIIDEALAAQVLDRAVEKPRRLAAVERAVEGESNWLMRMALDLHRCRRFYDRPENGDTTTGDPTGAKPPDLPANEAEFHGRCAMLGDHPELLRRLGLVIDLRVLDADRLRSSQWLSASLSVDGRAVVSRATRVLCQAEGDVFTTRAATDDWYHGALKIGRTERFSVLTLDTDGSAIKADQFLWTLPRLMRVEQNGDPVDAATPAQRSPGFTVAASGQGLRVQQALTRQAVLAADLRGERVPELSTEDVVRGLRAEVWDSARKRWFSLHRRLASAEVEGFGSVYAERSEESFIQGTAAHEDVRADQPPVHVHEALFGWDGWSLSVRRPGKRIWEKNGEAALLDEEPVAEEGSPHPFRITTAIEPGTLPRLRYGRSYAFRAWGVDLAGNSRPHVLNATSPAPVPPDKPDTAAVDPLSAPLLASVRMAVARRGERRAGGTDKVLAEQVSRDLAPEIVAYVRDRRAGAEGGAMLAAAGARSARVAAAAAGALESAEIVSFRAKHQPIDRERLIGNHLASLLPGRGVTGAGVAASLDTLTRPQPFLRWEPVSSPAVVPRWRFTEGESMRILVIRSGVKQDPGTLAITVEGAADFAAAANAREPACGYRKVGERHLAPPKVTQMQAEMHGMFDAAMGSSNPADHRRMMGWALRADGTFASTHRADIDNPPDLIAQPGMDIVQVGAALVAEQKTLPITPVGAPLGPGQTIVHDVDELALPYLPDPLAKGVAIHFPEAGRQSNLAFPHAGEGFTAAYGGEWPEVEPFRLVLESGPSLGGLVEGRTIRMSLPPGDIQELRVSSSLRKDKLDLLGPWSFLPAAVQDNMDIEEAAADGLIWALSPAEQVTLVHAVNRPLAAPRPVLVRPHRNEGEVFATLFGAVDVHGESTGVLAADASWTEMVDDPTFPQPMRRRGSARAFDTIVHPHEDIALLWNVDTPVDLPDVGRVDLHRAMHHFSDTRHRRVRYRFRAFTRFREFFHPTLLKDEVRGQPTDEMHSVVSPVLRLSIPSSARPAPPVVHSVLPLFRWSDEGEPEQPMARRRVRRAGVRIYLERPWFTSGDGELLGVLLATGDDDRHYPDVEDQSGFPFVSRWGADPIWQARQVDRRALPALRLENVLRLASLDDRGRAGRPVRGPQTLPLATLAGRPAVSVLGYRPRYNKQRELWFVDVAIDPGAQFWPFLRLAVARYQPESIAGCHLSAPVQCDFVQLPPERAASVSRTDDRHVRVTVGGPVGVRPASRGEDWVAQIERNRRVIARLQRRDPAIRSDLGWTTVAVAKLRPLGSSPDRSMATWMGELDAGEVLALQRPGEQEDWRVAVEEWELLEADLDPSALALGATDQKEARLVYADHLVC